ncbi:hypothetical protein [Chitinophaga nivalis]|uniref:Beta-hydroxyacyl-ACP dehydratase n=1 Tax=Chitinophaga nivalis TaxID=2991709 RepID=A0ABT3IIW5_9BACT|nr:hypothetical protein [Chitinophaga nivalis]MCW3466427.1 hypothetical protein [Chitinophaga nivalis]MCW3483882.1 hypothetical protein [Chitinophaga nivalis]
MEELLPHRHPFLFVDEILSATMEEIIGTQTFSRSSSLLNHNFENKHVSPSFIIESMAQCGGAGVKLLGVSAGLFGLVSIDHAEFFEPAEYGKKLKYVVKNIKLTINIIKQSGQAYIDDTLIGEASWMCVKLS